jgi:N-carbamoyl-L-amino-acid hydrolase
MVYFRRWRRGAQAIGDLRARRIFDYAPLPFATRCFDAVRQAALEFGLSHVDSVSGAGHDACYVARVAPTGMIFHPCISGPGHNEDDAITCEWAEAGAKVLLRMVLTSAGLAGER